MLHEWFRPRENGYPNLGDYESCKKCGVIRQANGSSDSRECRGVVRILPRTNDLASSKFRCAVCDQPFDTREEFDRHRTEARHGYSMSSAQPKEGE